LASREIGHAGIFCQGCAVILVGRVQRTFSHRCADNNASSSLLLLLLLLLLLQQQQQQQQQQLYARVTSGSWLKA